jgi:hypothetical protein
MGLDDDDVTRRQYNSSNGARKQAESGAERLFDESISFLEQ